MHAHVKACHVHWVGLWEGVGVGRVCCRATLTVPSGLRTGKRLGAGRHQQGGSQQAVHSVAFVCLCAHSHPGAPTRLCGALRFVVQAGNGGEDGELWVGHNILMRPCVNVAELVVGVVDACRLVATRLCCLVCVRWVW